MASFFRTRNRKARLKNPNRRGMIFESLERRQLLAGDVTVFADSFESGSNSNDWAGNWVEDSQNDWFRNTQRATDGNYSAEVDGRATDATLTMTNAVDLSGYDSATLTFDWLIETGFDSGEYLALDISSNGGASWTSDVLRLNGNSSQENTWHNAGVDLTTYASDDLLVRFRSKVSRSNEDANVDNVKITGTISDNQAPLADAGGDQTLSDAGGNGDEFVMLTGIGSDSDGTVASYQWSEGTTILGTTADISPTLTVGTHTLTFTVTDDLGATATDTVVITINDVQEKPVKVFLLAGQSNMNGTARVENLDPSWNVPQDDVWIWLDHNMDGGQWTTSGPGHGLATHAPYPEEPEGLDPRNGLGPELSLGRILADTYPDHRVALIKHSAGGRDLASHFNPDNIGPPESNEHMWSGLLKKTDDAFAVLDAAGYTYDVEGLFLAIGGGDARNRNSESSDPDEVLAGEQEALARSAQYGANLTNFISAVRDEYGQNLPVIMDQIKEDYSADLLAAYPGVELVRQGQLDVAEASPWTEHFSTTGITLRDAVHYDAMGQIEFGTRFANVYSDLINTPEISISDATQVTEGGLATFTVDLSEASDQPVSVDFATADGTATPSGDFGATSGTVVFEPGVTSRTIVVATIDDSEAEVGETFFVDLSSATGATIVDGQGIGTILDDGDVNNNPPAVDAGADQTLSDNDGSGSESVTLVGTASDSDGTITSAQWSDASGTLGTGNTLTTPLPVGVHTLTFNATDNEGASSSDSVIVTVVTNQIPSAHAGAEQTVTDNDDNGIETVALSGTASDPDGSIAAYSWSDGTSVIGTTASISPTLDVGTHTLTLTVTDNGGATDSVDVLITVVAAANQDPTADAGADQALSDNDGTGIETVTLSGSGSDPDGSIVGYQWTEGAIVLGNTANISPSLSVGTHTLMLAVTDNDGATASDTVVVTVAANQGPSVDAGADQTVTDSDGNGSETVTLNGVAGDSDGSIASYSWSDGTSVIGTTAGISPMLDVGMHTLTLTVTDNGGASSSDSVTVTVEAAPAAGPNLSHGSLTTVSSSWQTVTLGKSYTSMVVVATPRYNDGSGPGVVRINNVTANSFDVRVDNAGSASFSGGVHYIAVEEGVYDEPGFKLEAVKYDEAQTSRRSGWGIDTVGYQQSYTSPVVVGQVMSANDEDWSVFWASSGSRTSPPSSSALNVGKHVAEDPDTTRATETIGYLVIEATQDGTIEGLPFVAGVGGDTVRGVGNGTNQYSYDAMPNAKTAVLSSAGMDGNDGGWAVLRGDNPAPASSGTISLSIDEDQLRDSERNHTTEQVAYFVIDPPVGESSQNNETTPFATPVAGSSSRVKVDSIYQDELTAAEIPDRSTKLVSSAYRPEIGKWQSRIELIDTALSESDNDWSTSEDVDLLVRSLLLRASFGSR